MASLEDLTRGALVRGILPNGPVTVVDVRWFGDAAIELTYKDSAGRPGNQLLYRDAEPALAIVTTGRPWSFDTDGALHRLVSEARRIRLAYLFDPLLAVHTSDVEPLPHQITAVYEEMLPRQPLRFLLADDPGAGKTIMTGLLIKELLLRGDLHRCLVVCPGSLVEQWQDELSRRFDLPFEILTTETLEAARTGNWFAETPLAIARLDKLSRDPEAQAKLEQTDWDLIVCDEAHKLAATYFGNEVKYTKRYHLGQLLSGLTRHFLLLTATPHNGKEVDFQLFMALLDADRFEGKYRPEVHAADTADLMRRLVKEQLLTFDGTPLFPERIASTVTYTLSAPEAALYEAVTDYVRDQFNLADSLQSEGRKGTVGFALTVLQRRLASSPAAIYQSLRRRRERLTARLEEERQARRGTGPGFDSRSGEPDVLADDLDDLDDAPGDEVERTEEQIVARASAARTISELEREIALLAGLEALARRVRDRGTDRKWDELSRLLQEHPAMAGDGAIGRDKLVIFTEHRDTLIYLTERIRALLGQAEAVVIIHGGLSREARREAQERFTHDKTVEILIATDAAGEGINLQRAHLMVNYDLPWNPNRLEQRFGRIHRIGQTEVCHLWNLVAAETREGEVYAALLKKLEQERTSLGGQVFDVLGAVTFADRPLRELLVEAIRYGDRPDVRARLTEVVDQALDRDHLRELIDQHAIASDKLNAARVFGIREEMERAEARRLQPHFIAAFFLAAFRHLGGSVREREPRRYEITNVPAPIRQRDRLTGTGERVLPRYERIAFEKAALTVPGKPLAAFVCPGHPLLDATLDLLLERHGELLKQGTVLLDPTDPGEQARVLVSIEHAIRDGRPDRDGDRRVISRQLQFVAIGADGQPAPAGSAPYLDYRPLTPAEGEALAPWLETMPWPGAGVEETALAHAVATLVPGHLDEIRQRKEALVSKTMRAVHERLTKEVIYWDGRAAELKLQEEAGKTPKLNSGRASQRADELRGRLQRRLAELEQERHLAPLPPVVTGGALVVPAGLLRRLAPDAATEPDDVASAAERARVERQAMDAVLAAERALGYEPRDVGAEKRGYDVESRVPGSGRLRFIEVKGRAAGTRTVTLTKNEILTGLNKPDDFILALVDVDGAAATPRYVRRPFGKEPDFGATGVIYALPELLARAEEPS